MGEINNRERIIRFIEKYGENINGDSSIEMLIHQIRTDRIVAQDIADLFSSNKSAVLDVINNGGKLGVFPEKVKVLRSERSPRVPYEMRRIGNFNPNEECLGLAIRYYEELEPSKDVKEKWARKYADR